MSITKATDKNTSDGSTDHSVRVWDLPTRLFHWLTAGLFLFLVVTGENTDWLQRHMQAGYLLSGLVVFRLLWGLVGTYHARFWNFIPSPLTSSRYLVRLLQGRAEHYQGHNPAGAVMVIVLLFALLAQALTGLVTTDEILWEGPLYSSVPDHIAELGNSLHHQLGDLLQLIVLVHIAAVLYHRFRFREPLIGAMLHGRKGIQTGETDHYDGVSLPKLAVAVALGAAWVYWLFTQPL